MGRPRQTAWLVAVSAVAGLLLLAVAGILPPEGRRYATAQMRADLGSAGRFELDDTVGLDRADGKVLAQLERANACLADRQWDEAIATLRQVMEGPDDKLVPVDERRQDRFVSLREYGHRQLAVLPAEALKLYRSQVDAMALKWYRQGVADRDRGALLKVVEQAPASSWGDDALFALGEMALESGDYASARWCWERIIPQPEAPTSWPGLPDTDLDLAAVRARLVLVSILEGSPQRARDELTRFAELHGDARGRFGNGREEVGYAETLRALLADSAGWPPRKEDADWPTFAGSPLRNRVVPQTVDVAGVAWRVSLPEIDADDTDVLLSMSGRRPAGGVRLSYHPLLVGDLVLAGALSEILAIELSTGKAAWGQRGPAVYRAQLEGVAGEPSRRSFTLGVPRCTMTASGGKLYARMGTPITGQPQRAADPIRPGYLVCLDLGAEGRLMWKKVPEEGWALDGSPVADAARVYVAMRRSDVRPQVHVACLDARTGRRLWRRFVCGAETLARGTFYEITHNLLTLQRETVYLNTNLGAVAALGAGDGRLKWVTLYPRARGGDAAKLAPHWQRDLNPCLYDHGTLIVAPADSPRVFALDAATGQVLWQSGTVVEDVRHLLGTTEEHLIAAGDRLYWIALRGQEAGQVKHVWPDGPERLGCGRGLLAADGVLWPTKEKIFVLDQKTARPKKVIDLEPHGVTGGNLLATRGYLLIATGTELIAMGPQGARPQQDPKELTLVPTLRVGTPEGCSASNQRIDRSADGRAGSDTGALQRRRASMKRVPTQSVGTS